MLYWWDKGKTEEKKKQTLRVCKYFKASGGRGVKGEVDFSSDIK